MGESGQRPYCANVGEGTCADGKRFIFVGGFHQLVYYFDASATSVAYASQDDVGRDPCLGADFSPSLSAVRCEQPRQSSCGGPLEAIDLPFMDGRP